MAKTNQNRVAEILEQLTESYETFSEETEKPILRWQTELGDEEMIDVFVRYQQEHGEIRDLIMEMKVPFGDNGEAYAYALVEDLVRRHEEIKPTLAEEEPMDMGWTCPEPASNESMTGYLVRSLASFQAYYQNLFNHVALVLLPPLIQDTKAYAKWFDTLLKYHPPATVRFAMSDPLDEPILAYLAEAKPDQIHSEPLQLDYPAMLENLAQGEADPKAPDAQFRVLFVKLSNKAKEKDIEGAEAVAKQALAIAEAQNWFQMRVVVHSVLGAAYLQVEDFNSALRAYRTATDVSREATAAQDPAGPKMEIQCLFAEASTLFAMSKYMKAAEVYVAAAPLAEAAKDPFLTMEAWRMAAYCYEIEKDYSTAARYGTYALDAAERLPKEQREQSTLPYIVDALIRVIQTAKKKQGLFSSAANVPEEDEVNDRMVDLLGENWRESVMPGSQGAAPT